MILLSLLLSAQDPLSAQSLAFSIRADPTIAARVNEVLATLAEPVVSEIAEGADMAAALRTQCGELYSPRLIMVQQTGASAVRQVRHTPCLAFQGAREFVLEEGDTLENLSEIAGLRPSAFPRAEMQRGDAAWVPVMQARLRVGDRIRFRQTPAWINFRLAEPGTTRAQLVAALAAALECPAEGAEDCFRRKGLDLLDPQQTLVCDTAPSPDRPEEQPPHPADATRLRSFGLIVGAYSRRNMASALTAASEATTLPEDPPRAEGGVPAEQWPYDPRLVRAVLDADPDARGVAIGVADTGLGGRDGAPIPEAIFERNANEVSPEPDGTDDDRNRYVDDIFGGGVSRDVQSPLTGDLALCPGAEASGATFTRVQRLGADHGAIVASLATGLRLRPGGPAPRALPRLIFYRMLENLCQIADAPNAPPANLERAVDYLFTRSRVVVLSFDFTAPASHSFVSVLDPIVRRGERLLVVPSGNQSNTDLDRDRVCPACLGDQRFAGDAAEHIVVVGAATRSLHIAPYSNQGRQTVFIYAPGEPMGSLDVDGADASAHPAATSWAAPHAGLAIALMRALGLEDFREVRERLRASTWPILDENGGEDQSLPGILNLTQAIAVRSYSLQVMETGADGSPERRTYVGQLETPLQDLCPERSLSAGAVHAIQLGPASGGAREFRVRLRTFDDQLGDYPVDSWFCTPPATIRFTDLATGAKEFDSTQVVQVLLPWFL